MDQFKAFQLTTEEAMKVTGEGRGRGGKHKGNKRKGKLGKFLKGLSEEDRTTVKTAITGLKSGEGWADLSREDKRASIKTIIEPYKV